MSIAHDILPECFVDTNIVNTFLTMEQVYTDANHCHGCNKVGNMMQEKLKDNFALGIIDKDKRQHSYNKEFHSLGNTEHLELLKHPTNQHYLIRITPAMDGFILKVAGRQCVNMSDYDLPNNLKKFTEITKNASAKDNANLKKLFKNIVNDKEMTLLKNILGYISKNKYNCSDKELSDFFEAVKESRS